MKNAHWGHDAEEIAPQLNKQAEAGYPSTVKMDKLLNLQGFTEW
jgi:hypothetical protein